MIVRTLRQKLRRMLLWTTSTAGICISVSLFPISVTKIIAIYAEQMSPDSSFHFGAGPERTTKKPDEPMVPKISVVAMGANEDLQSEGGRYFPSRSALSSQCNSASSTTSNRRFQSAEKQLHHIYQGKDLFQRSKYRM